MMMWWLSVNHGALAGDTYQAGVNQDLPIHKQKKIHPELSDPVLGDRAAIVEWAWSPKYAKKFGLKAQKDGLEDGDVWLLGIKIIRSQYGDKNWQQYQCRIVGLLNNKIPIVMPPGERFFMHPAHQWFAGLPGKNNDYGSAITEQRYFQPAQVAWHRVPKNKKQETHPERGIGTNYILFYRYYTIDLAYFEVEGACSYFGDPKQLINELRFPAMRQATGSFSTQDELVYQKNAIRVEIPTGLLVRIYPYIQDAVDWSSCYMRRIGNKSFVLSSRALRTRRFGESCEPERRHRAAAK
jgi:hypothetical protein